MAKYHEKSTVLYVAKQSVANTAETILATHAIPCLSLDYSTPVQTEAFQYVGSITDRDEITTITDRTTELKAQVLVPRLGTVAGTLAASSVPLIALFEISNVNATISGTATTTKVTLSNAAANSAEATAQFRRITPDVATQKTYQSKNCLATVDFEMMVGTRGKFSFNLKGNFLAPTENVAITPDYGTLKDLYAAPLKESTLMLAEVYDFGVAATDTTNICLFKIAATNLFGQQIDRALTACDESYSRISVPGDLTLTVREDAANVGKEWNGLIGNTFGFNMKWSDNKTTPGTGTTTKFNFSRLQLVDVQKASVAGYAGFDLKFRIIGTTAVVLDSASTGSS